MKDIQDTLARAGKHLAEIAQAVVKAIDDLTPEQRAVIEFLAENPKVAEAFQELNQKLARQRAIGGATKETARPAEPLIKDASMQQEIIDLNNRVAKLERQTAESQSHIPESSIGKWF